MNYYTRKPSSRQVFLGCAWRSMVLAGWALGVQVGLGGPTGLERGWATAPGAGLVLEVPGRPRPESRRRRRRPGRWRAVGRSIRAGWRGVREGCWVLGVLYVERTWRVVLVRSGVLWWLWALGGERAPGWLVGGAVLRWGLVGLGEVWPGLWRGELYRGLVRSGAWLQRGCLWGLVGAWGQGSWGGGACLVVPGVEVEQEEDGSYRIRLHGPLELRVGGADKFRLRLVMLFLRELEGPEERRGSRATRTGRRPLVRQDQIAAWFGVKQPHLSRWEKYWLAGDWRRLLSQKWGEVLTGEVHRAVIQVWVRHLSWGAQRVRDYLAQQGVPVTLRQVQQVAEESGWGVLREELRKRYVLGAEGLRPREEWVVEGLLGQVQRLVELLEAVGGLPPEERIAVAEWWEESAAVGLSPRVESEKRWGEEGTPEGLAAEEGEGPESAAESGPELRRRVSLSVRERAIWMYVGLGSTYRRVAHGVGVEASTVYRWVRAWGQGLVPVAALLGVVRSSGTVGVDEKYVLVPKNDKTEGKKKRWMYVYLAVDVYTYDLLHIAIYPYCTQKSAQAFLLALRAKGYHPAVIVTDLREDYGPVIAAVFPRAEHHECIFHFEQAVGRMLREVYGKDYAETHPEAELLRQILVEVLRSRTKRTAYRRYQWLMEFRADMVAAEPGVAAVFDLIEKHWPKVVNAIESRRIPRTNNAVEGVIGRLDQYYQNYRGFESITTAEAFLGVFEKVYRLTPLTEDARAEVRGKCPLELAGYDVSKLPWTRVVRAGPELWGEERRA